MLTQIYSPRGHKQLFYGRTTFLCLFSSFYLFLRSGDLVFSASLLYRESFVDDSQKTLPTEQHKQARGLAAKVGTHTHTQQQTHTCAVGAQSLRQSSCGSPSAAVGWT